MKKLGLNELIVVSSDPIQHRKTLFYVAKAKSGVEIEEASLNLPALNPSFDHSAELESTYRYWLPLRDVCQACKLDYDSIDKVRKSLAPQRSSFKSIRYQRRDSSNQQKHRNDNSSDRIWKRGSKDHTRDDAFALSNKGRER
jgi:hypothetical protein